jgi:RNase P subunit RPR2
MGEQHEAYCVKCRKKVVMKNHEHVTLKNTKPAVQGVCPSCGTKVFRIGQG